MQISDDAVEALHLDGATCLRGALDASALAGFEQAWRWSIDHPGPLASPLTPGATDAVQDLCNPDALARYRAPLLESAVGAIAARVMPSTSVWFMYEQVFHKWAGRSAPTPWHQDTSYLAVNGPDLLVMWISFDPVPRSAALEFVRASHRGPLYNTSRFDLEDPTRPIFDSSELPRLPAIEAQRSRFDLLGWATEPGDVVLFHPSTLHGGGPTSAEAPERRTLTLRFFGERAHFEARPGPAGPFYEDLRNSLVPGAPFRHERFLRLV